MVKCLFPYTHVGKTQEFNHKMDVIDVNLEANMGMIVSIHPYYGWQKLNLHGFNT